MPDKYTQIILKEAARVGARFEPLDNADGVFLLRRKNRHTFIMQSMPELTSNTAFRIASNKYLTNWHLRRAGFAVPQCRLIHNYSEALAALKTLKKIVIKPLGLNRGRGITVGIKDETALRQALVYAAKSQGRKTIDVKRALFRLLAERAVPGDDHRLLVLDYRAVYGIKKIPAYVMGDGVSTIAELVAAKNKIRAKHKNKMVIDAELRRVLARQGLFLRSRPAKNERVFVRRTANLATGGESEDITDELPEKLKTLARRAARQLRLPVVGFDFMSRDFRTARGYFIEANPIPGLLIHHYPTRGRRRNVSRGLIKLLIRKKCL